MGKEKMTTFINPVGPYISLHRLRFNPTSIYVGSVISKVAMGQVSLQALWFSPVSIILLMLHNHSSATSAIQFQQLAASLRQNTQSNSKVKKLNCPAVT
jgi:hypothetical protein